jgi:predicted RNase H-like HicB family nuclease
VFEEELEHYLNLDWTLIEGTDLDFNGEPYFYLEIKEFPSFVFCAKTKEKAYDGYKRQLKLTLMIMLEDGDKIPNPGDDPQEECY